MAGKARRARWQILPQQHRKILFMLRSGHGIRKTAALVGVGVRTVQRRAEIIRTATLEDGEADYRRSNQPRRCEVHGLVTIWPCVACAAIAHTGPPARIVADTSDSSEDGNASDGRRSIDTLADPSRAVVETLLADLQRGTCGRPVLYLDPATAAEGAASHSQGR